MYRNPFQIVKGGTDAALEEYIVKSMKVNVDEMLRQQNATIQKSMATEEPKEEEKPEESKEEPKTEEPKEEQPKE